MDNKLKILELFGGIGACTSAFKRLGMPIEIVDYVEIDRFAVASYNLINDTHFEPQDITKWNKDVQVDFILHGSPCQDISLAGHQAGADEGSGTRSSLMYETLRIVRKLNPKYVVWENVKNLVSKKHFHNFQNYLNQMEELGYTSYWKVLNTKDFGIPQNRERVFVVSIRKDVDTGFEFPQPIPLEKKLKDLLEDEVDEKYYLSDEKIVSISRWKAYQKPFEKVLGNNSICATLTARGAGEEHSGMITYSSDFEDTTNVQQMLESKQEKPTIKIKNNTKQGYLDAHEGDGVDISSRMQHHRGTVQQQLSHTIDCAGGNAHGVVVKNLKQILCDQLIETNQVSDGDVIIHSYTQQRLDGKKKCVERSDGIMITLTVRCDTVGTAVKDKSNNLRIRKLTPRECWRLQGRTDEEFDKVKGKITDSQLYKQAGNSITVDVLCAIFTELFKCKE